MWNFLESSPAFPCSFVFCDSSSTDGRSSRDCAIRRGEGSWGVGSSEVDDDCVVGVFSAVDDLLFCVCVGAVKPFVGSFVGSFVAGSLATGSVVVSFRGDGDWKTF